MPDPVRETSWQSPASLAPEEDLKSLLLSERSGDSEKAIGTLVGLLSSRIEEKRARGYALYREALEEALYRSCLNYRSLVRGFTHPLLSVMEQAIETWADAPRRKPSAEENMTKVVVPPALKAEHDELHAELAAATKLPGAVGAAAGEVAKLLHPHFIKEEEFALPPLGLLMTIARGGTVAGNEAVVAMADRLKRELPDMLAEHAGDSGRAREACRRCPRGRGRGAPEIRREARGACAHRGSRDVPRCHPRGRFGEA